ncbi:hypothetical protein KAS42_02475 [bacterium]|nr:hypothetical protein [bacterium]
MQRLLLLILGALLGSLLTRQYETFKGRENDAHLLLLALNEISDFETNLLCWQNFPSYTGPLKEVQTTHIKRFLETKLSLFLRIEVREDFKQLIDWIDQSNEFVHQFPHVSISKTIANTLAEFAAPMEKSLHEPLCRIWNSVLYTHTFRYRILGLSPNDIDILKKRTPGELAEFHFKYKV